MNEKDVSNMCRHAVETIRNLLGDAERNELAAEARGRAEALEAVDLDVVIEIVAFVDATDTTPIIAATIARLEKLRGEKDDNAKDDRGESNTAHETP